MFLTFPIMVIRVNTIDNIVEWRWELMFMVGIGSFFLSFLWRFLLKRKEIGKKEKVLYHTKISTVRLNAIPGKQRLVESVDPIKPRFRIQNEKVCDVKWLPLLILRLHLARKPYNHCA